MATIQKSDWLRKEVELRQMLKCLPDDPELDEKINYPLKIGGADLSFLQDDPTKAVCCYVVLRYDDSTQIEPTVIYQNCKLVELSKYYAKFNEN